MSVTAAERRALERIGDGYHSAQELATVLGVSYGSTYASLISLERKGYVRGVATGTKRGTTFTQTGRGADALKEALVADHVRVGGNQE